MILAGGSAGTEVPAYPEAKTTAKSPGLIYHEALSDPRLEELVSAESARLAEAAGDPFVTDEGNYILDCWSEGIAEPESTAAEIRSIVGVVEHGLFLGMATVALVAGEDGVKEYRA